MIDEYVVDQIKVDMKIPNNCKDKFYWIVVRPMMGMNVGLLICLTCQQNENHENAKVKLMCSHTSLVKMRNNHIILLVRIDNQMRGLWYWFVCAPVQASKSIYVGVTL